MIEPAEWPAFGLREPTSSISHYGACLWSCYALLVLLRLCRQNRWRQASVACFGVSACLLYAASGTYHGLCLPPERLEFYRLLDHSAIYLLIAGTFTPIFAILLRGPLRVGSLTTIWTLAILGIIAKWTLPTGLYWVTVCLYLVLGAVGMLPVFVLARILPARGTCCGLLGSLLYTLGALADLIGWPVLYRGVFGSHALLHLFVISGTVTHFIFIARHVIPYRGPEVTSRLSGPSFSPEDRRRAA